MKINKIKIAGFRSIKDDLEIPLQNLNAIIGANNSGKSNIINAIYKVLGKDWITKNNFDELDVHNEEYDRDITIEIEFEQPFKYEQFKGIPIDIPKIRFNYTRYKVGELEGQRRLEKQCLTLTDKQVFGYKQKPKKGEKPQMIPLTTIPQEVLENLPVIYIGFNRNIKYHLPKSRNSILGTILEDINKDFEDESNTIEVKKRKGETVSVPRKERFNQCIKEAIRCLTTDEFKKLESSIRENALHQLGLDPSDSGIDIFFEPLSSLDFYKSLEIFIKENNYSINATELGGGFQNALVISILKAFEERRKAGALFLIEEPEMYLHPQMQRSLYKTLRAISETNQIIYITHSPNFVTIPNFDEIILVSKSNSGTKITKSNLDKTEALENKFIKELDPERNELFFAKKLLIVEGDTEKLAFPEFAKRLDKDFDNSGSSIIEVGGKRNLIDFVNLALSFNIPVGLVYDTDSSDFKGKKDEEKDYNELLDSYINKGVKVWKFEKNYEDECKKFYTEPEYSKFCQKYGRNKTMRARLMAMDNDIPIPEFIKPIVEWLAE